MTEQLKLKLKQKPSHGGRRKGAGRPNRSGKRAHVRREKLSTKHPVHVTLRLAQGLPSLRTKDAFKSLRKAVKAARARGLEVNHFSVLSNHVHLILEPRESSLGRVFQSFGVALARQI